MPVARSRHLWSTARGPVATKGT